MTTMLRITLLATLAAAAASSQTVPPLPTMPALSADLEVERTLRSVDGNTVIQRASGHFYRDDQRRTRLEWGDHVTIFDPVARTTMSLNLKKRTARVTDLANKPIDRRAGGVVDDETPGGSDLGVQTIEGYQATGKEYVSVTPVTTQLGNTQPIKRVSRLWYSAQLTIPLVTIMDDPFTGQVKTAYRNLRVGANPDPRLFTVPEGFTVINSTWEPPRTAPPSVRNPHLPE